MSHTIHDKKRLLSRVKRIRGQIDAIERALEDERGCIDILQQITSCRGAMNGLLSAMLEEHIRTHLVDAEFAEGATKIDSREQLVEIVHSYFK